MTPAGWVMSIWPTDMDGDGDRDVVVDWKTGIAGSADQAQLDIYRRAWASITGVSEDQVDAEFVYLPLT